ncbi:MAG: hypothetical protein MEQ07_11055 [Aquimonas sp.]|nr:hypothetical protein [Aquimonas sp.]
MDIPQLAEWFKVIAPAIAVGALFWKTSHGFLRLRRRRWIEEFKLSRAVLRRGIENIHPFELESWYTSVSGGGRLSFAKIRCALETGAPSEVLDRLRKADEYVTVKELEDGSVALVGTESDTVLKRWFWILAGLYGVFAVVAGLPIFARPFLPELIPVGVIAYIALVSLPSTWMAVLCMREGQKVRAARELTRDFPRLALPVAKWTPIPSAKWTPIPSAPNKSPLKALKAPKTVADNMGQSPS